MSRFSSARFDLRPPARIASGSAGRTGPKNKVESVPDLPGSDPVVYGTLGKIVTMMELMGAGCGFTVRFDRQEKIAVLVRGSTEVPLRGVPHNTVCGMIGLLMIRAGIGEVPAVLPEEEQDQVLHRAGTFTGGDAERGNCLFRVEYFRQPDEGSVEEFLHLSMVEPPRPQSKRAT